MFPCQDWDPHLCARQNRRSAQGSSEKKGREDLRQTEGPIHQIMVFYCTDRHGRKTGRSDGFCVASDGFSQHRWRSSGQCEGGQADLTTSAHADNEIRTCACEGERRPRPHHGTVVECRGKAGPTLLRRERSVCANPDDVRYPGPPVVVIAHLVAARLRGRDSGRQFVDGLHSTKVFAPAPSPKHQPRGPASPPQCLNRRRVASERAWPRYLLSPSLAAGSERVSTLVLWLQGRASGYDVGRRDRRVSASPPEERPAQRSISREPLQWSTDDREVEPWRSVTYAPGQFGLVKHSSKRETTFAWRAADDVHSRRIGGLGP